MKTQFLCLIIETCTGREIKEYRPDAVDDYYARHIAANMFKAEHPHFSKRDRTRTWHVESCEI